MLLDQTRQVQVQPAPQPLICRGVRGATTVQHNDAEEILRATRELLHNMATLNEMKPADIASIYFTTTADLTAVHPAEAARQLGWQNVALLCAQEIAVPGGLDRCIRVLIHWNTCQPAQNIQHVYLKNARLLRPDLQNKPLVRPRQINEMDAMIRALQTA